ncbi:MAG: VanZ family protein [Microbacteriaceae bacterium]|uniref:VanZ family protein n=1 Tax=Microbacterium sp. TaxID=51671 RepID=UPI003F96B5F9
MPRPSAVAITARVLLVPYAIALALIVWLPDSVASRVTGIVFRLARFVAEHAGVSLSTTYTVFEFAANIALFIPFGLLLAAGWPRTNVWWIILMGFSASATIELVQTMIPGRVTTLSDVIANTLGTIIGCCAVRLFAPRLRSQPATV